MLPLVPPFSWPVDATNAAHVLDAAPRGYLMWSVWSVDALQYLQDLDQRPERRRWIDAGHHPATIDVTHARWAAGIAITALDLGAATLGAQHNLSTRWPDHVHDVVELNKHYRGDLCGGCLRWLDDIVTDPDFEILKSARDPLVHRMLGRALYATINDSLSGRPLTEEEQHPDDRLGLYVPVPGATSGTPREIPAAEIVERARDTATRHIVALIQAAQSGAL